MLQLFCHLLTTLLCTIFDADVELTRTGVARGWDRTEAVGEDFWCRDDAAAAVNPREDRRVEKGKRRKIEENSLTVGIVKRGKGKKKRTVRETRERGYFNFNEEKRASGWRQRRGADGGDYFRLELEIIISQTDSLKFSQAQKREILRNQLCRDPVTCALLSKRPKARIHDIMKS